MGARAGWLAAAVLVMVASGCGMFSDDGVEAGVCLERGSDADAPRNAEVVDCDRPHDIEVIEVLAIEGFDQYPGDADLTRWAFNRCVDLFEEYVGQPYGSSLLDLDIAVPDEQVWSDGDRYARCGVTNADGSRRDRSVRS